MTQIWYHTHTRREREREREREEEEEEESFFGFMLYFLHSSPQLQTTHQNKILSLPKTLFPSIKVQKKWWTNKPEETQNLKDMDIQVSAQ